MKKKWLAAGLSLTVLAGVVGGVKLINPKSAEVVSRESAIPVEKVSADTIDKVEVKKKITKAILEQGVKSEKSGQIVELLVLSNGKDISEDLEEIGAEVSQKSTSVYVIKIPADKAMDVASIEEVSTVGKDQILNIPKPIEMNEFIKDSEEALPMLEYSHEVTTIPEFWNKGYDGKDTIVSIIDTGVEPGNEMLTLTTDGKLKIVDYQDFWGNTGDLSEGDVVLSELEVQTEGSDKYIDNKGIKVNIPDTADDKVLFGTFDESKVFRIVDNQVVPHDINNNNEINDKVAVIVLNYDDEDLSNDRILVDTNLNSDLSDENEMGIYKEVAKELKDKVIFELGSDNKPVLVDGIPQVKDQFEDSYSMLVNNFENLGLGNNAVGSTYNFVVTKVEPYGEQWIVNLGYDGNSHGSHVAGDAAGNGYTVLPFMNTDLKDSEGRVISDGTLKGAAPGAQVIACRVFQSNGGTPQSAFLAAMEYSCESGADVINMSLGSLPDIDDGTDPGSIFVNQLSKQYGTVFCISAGNEGPSTNAIGTPGTGEWAITVGAYNPGWINYGYAGIEDGLWYFSSRGPTEDGRLKPTIVAPGSMISSYPMWMNSEIRAKGEGGGSYVGYGLEQGTSMSSPYTAGTIAAIKQAINEKNLPYHPLVVKEAVFETGDKDINDETYLPSEIGGGMIDPCEALEYLENLSAKGLTQADLETADGFIDRGAINVKTEFDYTEKLSYKPEGLYVRSGDIPEKVEVTLTNTQDRDLSLTLTKDSYNYSNEWLGLSEAEVNLAKGESKTLSLSIDKTKLNQGINSLIIRMEDKNTPLSEGYIPVTVINYLDLNGDNLVISEDEETEFKPGSVSKHFIRIPYGTKKVEIEVEMTDSGDTSSLLPIVTEPSGIQLEDVPGADWLYSLNNRKTLVLNNPVEGTWEIDLFSGIIADDSVSRATGKHTVTAKVDGVLFNPSVVEYSGKSGEYIENDLSLDLLNGTVDENEKISLVTSTLVSEDANKITKRMDIMDGNVNIVKFTIPENDPNLFVNIQTRNPKNESDDIDISLAKIIKDDSGRENLSTPIAVSQGGDSDEDIYIDGLSSGEYAILIESFNAKQPTSYDLIYQIANNSFGEKAITLREKEVTLGTDGKTINLGLRVPVKKGNYVGFIYAVDKEGIVLGRGKIQAIAESTDNAIGLSYDSVIRTGDEIEISIDGEVKDLSKLNNIYGVQFEIEFDKDNLVNAGVLKGDLFSGTDAKEIFRKVEEGKITYAVGFLNASGDKDAVGAINGNIAKIKAKAEAIGSVSLKFSKLLAVNFSGDEVAINTLMDNSLIIANPDLTGEDSKVDIRDISKLASKVGKLENEDGFNEMLDINKDGTIDYKDLEFMANWFKEDN